MICSTTRGSAAFGGVKVLDRFVAATGADLHLFQGEEIEAARLFIALDVDVVVIVGPGVGEFEDLRGSGNIEALHGLLHELGKPQRAVVEGAGEAEAVVDEHGFAAAVALIHAADLGDGDVALVHHEHEVFGGEEI